MLGTTIEAAAGHDAYIDGHKHNPFGRGGGSSSRSFDDQDNGTMSIAIIAVCLVVILLVGVFAYFKSKATQKKNDSLRRPHPRRDSEPLKNATI